MLPWLKESIVRWRPDFSVILNSGLIGKNVFEKQKRYNMNQKAQESHTSNIVYGMGIIGAAVYYISTATGFWMGVVGFLKALVWPAILVYEALKSFAG